MKKSLKAREFKLTTKFLEYDFSTEIDQEIVEEYLFEDLEIPCDCVKKLDISNKYINITLNKNIRYFNEDWYVNLQRVGWLL